MLKENAIAFYELEEVRDLLAYCCVIINPKDEEALLRVINIPRRISEEAVEKLLGFAEEHDLSLWDSLTSCQLDNVDAESIQGFVSLMSDLKELVNKADAYDFLKEVLLATKLLNHYSELGDKSKLVIRQLLTMTRSFSIKGNYTITDYLGAIALLKSDNVIIQ